MRQVTPQTLNLLQKNLGTEPILLIEVEWIKDGQKIMYSDQRINDADYPYPTIIQVSGFDTALMVKGSSDSQSIGITLDDVDGKIKEIFNNYDIHKRSVWVYQVFEALTLDHKFLLFQGEICSPIIWDEGARTLSFDILTRIEDTEVAFSMEEGDFPSIPEEALGKVWPLIFGQVCNMKAVQVRAPRRGYLQSGEGIHDFTLEPRICQARYIQCPSVSVGETSTVSQETDGGYSMESSVEYAPDPECVRHRFAEICNLLWRLEQETSWEHAELNIRGGGDFPQGEYTTININGAKFRGTFNGTYFTVQDREHPEYAEWEHQACRQIKDHAYGITKTQADYDWEETDSKTAWTRDGSPETLEDCNQPGVWRQGPVGGPSESWKAYEDIESAGFFWIPAGSEVYVEEEAELLYIVSLIPGTIDSVAAYKKQASGRGLLMEVPTDFYTIYETDYDGYVVIEIGMDRKLSQRDSDWDDNLYISFTSDVGPNPVDIIEWLIDKYTSLTKDTTSFTYVKSKMTNYPTNFWMKERMNVLELIRDITYQTRCAAYIRNNIIYLKYLSEEPTSVRTLNESDIIANTFQIKLTETEDLVTKHIINWQKTEAGVEEDNEVMLKIILKHNVSKYGLHSESYKYYTQNTYNTILKSATFWMIRKANSWKLVEFDAPLKHLDLDIFDCITLNIEEFSSNSIKVVIKNATYNPDNNSIHFECWTPILAGTDNVYCWAWPANQDAARIFPLTEEEVWAGAGYEFDVTPPTGHILRGGYVDTGDGMQLIMTAGDRHPSDTDDTAPTIYCEVSDLVELEEEDPAFKALELAQSNRQTQQEQEMSKDTPSSGTDSKKKKPRTTCGAPEYGDGCVFEVTVIYIMPDLVTSGKILGGCKGGPCGRAICGHVCTGSTASMCHTFGAAFTASFFAQSKRAEIEELTRNCGYCSNVTWYPWQVFGPKGIPDPNSAVGGECEQLPGDPEAPNQGEQYEPKESTA
jgi:hypothetical protein